MWKYLCRNKLSKNATDLITYIWWLIYAMSSFSLIHIVIRKGTSKSSIFCHKKSVNAKILRCNKYDLCRVFALLHFASLLFLHCCIVTLLQSLHYCIFVFRLHMRMEDEFEFYSIRTARAATVNQCAHT